jgi:hypothetical protein
MLRFHSLAVVLTLVHVKQIRIIYINEAIKTQYKQYKTQIQEHIFQNTYALKTYTYEYVHPHITKPVKTNTVEYTHQMK